MRPLVDSRGNANYYSLLQYTDFHSTPDYRPHVLYTIPVGQNPSGAVSRLL